MAEWGETRRSEDQGRTGEEESSEAEWVEGLGCKTRMTEASGSSSVMDVLEGSSSMVRGGSRTWFVAGIGSGSVSMEGSGVELGSMAEDL